MNEDDIARRNLTYGRLAELGRAPTAAEIAAVVGLDEAEVMAGWERLHAEHAWSEEHDLADDAVRHALAAEDAAWAARLVEWHVGTLLRRSEGATPRRSRAWPSR